MCPFCYIGKRKIEIALTQFPFRDKIEIEWKSFELNPNLKTDTNRNLLDYLADSKGISHFDAKKMMNYVVRMANDVGLTYHMHNAVVANSFNAHRFLHYAKAHGKQDEAEEKLFKAYFTLGKNTDDLTTLLELGEELELNIEELKVVLFSNQYADAVRADEKEAKELGISGVPFFLFDKKLSISGAQDESIILNGLLQSYYDYSKVNNK